MTPTEQWICELALVYAIPSFFSGVGVTLLILRWRDIRRAAAMTARLLSPELTFEETGFLASGAKPTDGSEAALARK